MFSFLVGESFFTAHFCPYGYCTVYRVRYILYCTATVADAVPVLKLLYSSSSVGFFQVNYF